MKVNVYVDGFNLYYGVAHKQPYHWLDLGKLCRLMLPRDEINRIRYFTAKVKPRADDPTKLVRQLTYFRALRTIPGLLMHDEGTFLQRPVRMALTKPLPNGPRTVEVWQTQEKGSDVNLATHMIFDGIERDYEGAAVISNDSDLVMPIKMIREKLGLPVGVLNPHREMTSYALLKAATYYKTIQERVLRKSLFADVLEDADGQFHNQSGGSVRTQGRFGARKARKKRGRRGRVKGGPGVLARMGTGMSAAPVMSTVPF